MPLLCQLGCTAWPEGNRRLSHARSRCVDGKRRYRALKKNAIATKTSGNCEPTDAIERVIVRPDRLVLSVKQTNIKRSVKPIEIPWQKPERGRPISTGHQERTAIDSQSGQPVRAHAWLRLLVSGEVTSIEALARSASLRPKVLRQQLQVALIAPERQTSLLGSGDSK